MPHVPGISIIGSLFLVFFSLGAESQHLKRSETKKQRATPLQKRGLATPLQQTALHNCDLGVR